MALDKQFVLRLETSTHKKLAERAGEENLSTNMLLNRLVSLYLEGKIDINDNHQVTDESIQNWEKFEAEIEEIKHRLQLLENRSSQEYIHDKPLVQVVVKEDSSVTQEYLSSPEAPEDKEDKSISDNSELSAISPNNYTTNHIDSTIASNTDSNLGGTQETSEIEKESSSDSNELTTNINSDSSSDTDSSLKGELEEDVMTDSASSLSKVSEQNVSESQIEQALDEDTDKNNIDNDSSSDTDSNKEELKDVGVENDSLTVDEEKQVPQAVIDLFKEAGASGKVRQSKILNAVGLDKKALANPPQWWSKIEFNEQKWGVLELDQD